MKAAAWMKKNTIIPLSMAGITAVFSLVYLNSEVDPESYRTLWQSWDTIPDEVRGQIAHDFKSHDYISRNEYSDVRSQLKVTYHEVRNAGDYLNIDSERTKVQELINNPTLRPYKPFNELENMKPVSPGVYTSKGSEEQADE